MLLLSIQSVSIFSRQVVDSFLTANEVSGNLNSRKKKKKKGWIVKLKFEKAYATIDWNCSIEKSLAEEASCELEVVFQTILSQSL